MKRAAFLILLTALATGVAVFVLGGELFATPVESEELSSPELNPLVLSADGPTFITVTAHLNNLNVKAPKIQIFDPTKGKWRTLRPMKDNGKHGDQLKDDRVFTARLWFSKVSTSTEAGFLRPNGQVKVKHSVPSTPEVRITAKMKGRGGVLLVSPSTTLNAWPLPLALDKPEGWIVRQDPGAVTLSNVPNLSPLSEDALSSEAFFRVEFLKGAYPGDGSSQPPNPSALPVDQWFAQYFANGFAAEPQSITSTIINGYPAIRVELPELGGLRAHVFIAHGDQVVWASYGLFASQFIPTYEEILNSITFPS